MRLQTDLYDVLEAVVEERLDEMNLTWDPRPAVTVVMAAEGYPGNYERGRVIHGVILHFKHSGGFRATLKIHARLAGRHPWGHSGPH